jgi:hypothetical protein
MNLVFLALIQFTLVTQQPPEIYAYFDNTETCMVNAEKLNKQHGEELAKGKAAFVCLVAQQVGV